MTGEDDYDDGVAEGLLEAGWMCDDDVQTLRTLLRFIEFEHPPRVGNKHDAALILIEHQLRVGDVDENEPNLVWARHLMKEHI